MKITKRIAKEVHNEKHNPYCCLERDCPCFKEGYQLAQKENQQKLADMGTNSFIAGYQEAMKETVEKLNELLVDYKTRATPEYHNVWFKRFIEELKSKIFKETK